MQIVMEPGESLPNLADRGPGGGGDGLFSAVVPRWVAPSELARKLPWAPRGGTAFWLPYRAGVAPPPLAVEASWLLFLRRLRQLEWHDHTTGERRVCRWGRPRRVARRLGTKAQHNRQTRHSVRTQCP